MAFRRAATLEDRMHHLESLIQSIPFNLFGTSTAGFPQTPLSTSDPSGPHASLASATHAYPLGVPPPSLSIFPLMNPSTHFPASTSSNGTARKSSPRTAASQLAEETARMSVSPSYLYLDDEGYTRWQGETSGLPLLDFLVERELPTSAARSQHDTSPVRETWPRKSENVTTGDWFPDRQPRRVNVNPETLWKIITSVIAPELMDRSVFFLFFYFHFPPC